MLIENGYHYRTLYVVVRLSELDLKTWILSFSFETITENENGYRFQIEMIMILILNKSFPQFSKVFHNPVESRWKLV